MREHEEMYLLVWNDHYGCEGAGHAYVGVFNNETDATLAARTWEPPTGYNKREGGYDVETVPVFT